MEKEEYLSFFQGWMKDKDKADSTQKEYLYNVRQYLNMIQKPLEQTTKLDCMKYLTKARERGNSATTRNRKLMAIRTFYKAMMDLELLTHNPAKQVELAKEKKDKIPSYLDSSTLQIFLNMMEKKQTPVRNRAMVILMAMAGLRVVEVQNMNVGDIFEEVKGIQVRGKGGKYRFVPISEKVLQLLLEVKKTRPHAKPMHRQALFISRQGERISRRRIQQIVGELFDELKKQEGMERLKEYPLSCHKLRHTFGTNLVQAGVDLRTIQELMGHESPATTQIYTHVNDHQKILAIEKLNKWVQSKEKGSY